MKMTGHLSSLLGVQSAYFKKATLLLSNVARVASVFLIGKK